MNTKIPKPTLFHGHYLNVMLEYIPDESIDLMVTSPPYDEILEDGSVIPGGLRTYGKGETYTWDLHSIVNQSHRVLKKGGVIVWVMNDLVIDGSETLSSAYTPIHFVKEGFNKHDTMIMKKHNFSNPSNNRYHQIFEYMFVFSKGKPKTFNPIKDKPNVYAGSTTYGRNTVTQKDGTKKERPKKVYSEFGMRGNIWEYIVGTASGDDKRAFEHPAVFPEKLVEDHILSWSNPHDVVLDPFMGSGTVGVVAQRLDRQFVGIEINKEYYNLAKKRIKK